MLKIGLLIMMTMFGTFDYAQDGYFVLIQSENHQPFYVRLGDRLFSSSAEGHLILSRLKDSTYNITIGFPGQPSPDQQFTWTVQRDQELQLKSLGDKGWGLLNLRTNDLKMPDRTEHASTGLQPKGIKKDDAFSRLMAGVVADTAVMYNTYAMVSLPDSAHVADSLFASRKPLARPDSAAFQPPGQPVIHPDLVSAVRPPAVQIESSASGSPSVSPINKPAAEGAKPLDSAKLSENAKLSISVKPPDSLKVPDSVKRTDPSVPAQMTEEHRPEKSLRAETVVKLNERKTIKGLRIVYTLRVEGQKADTVVVLIPPDISPASTAKNDSRPDSAMRVMATPDSTAAVPAAKPPIPFINSDCHNFATDYDVDKLRVKMLQAANDDDRIQAARKVFHSRCFSTKQIKALTEVFTTDEMKYRFLEAAYPYASDGEFKDLSEILADPIYNHKFKVMTGQR
jgi:hypothetical protein